MERKKKVLIELARPPIWVGSRLSLPRVSRPLVHRGQSAVHARVQHPPRVAKSARVELSIRRLDPFTRYSRYSRIQFCATSQSPARWDDDDRHKIEAPRLGRSGPVASVRLANWIEHFGWGGGSDARATSDAGRGATRVGRFASGVCHGGDGAGSCAGLLYQCAV